MQLSSLFLLLGSTLAAPAPSSFTSSLTSSLASLIGRSTTPSGKMCGQYQSQTKGIFTLSTDGWDWPAGNGTQCSGIDAVSGNAIAWDTFWSWTGISYQVKSYTNVQTSFTKKKLSAYSNIPTTWYWNYTGTNLSCNVAYDTFLGTTASIKPQFEVMVWIGAFGDISPLSDNGYPFTPYASPTLGGVLFDLAHGYNADGQVFSFVARNHSATQWNGNLLSFYRYLYQNYPNTNFTSDLYLQNIQAGTEVFTGSNATLTTKYYSISVV